MPKFKAESDQALREKLVPTIILWTTCLQEFDKWTMQQAVVRVCKTCKFPPSIAEMREAGDKVLTECRAEISAAYQMVRNEFAIGHTLGKTQEQTFDALPPKIKRVIAVMGGMEKFAPPDKNAFDMQGFERTYEQLLRSTPIQLPGHPALVAAKTEKAAP